MTIGVKYSSNCSLVCRVVKSHWDVYHTVAIATYQVYIGIRYLWRMRMYGGHLYACMVCECVRVCKSIVAVGRSGWGVGLEVERGRTCHASGQWRRLAEQWRISLWQSRKGKGSLYIYTIPTQKSW